MNTRPKSPTPPPASISMRDIYYVLFRHKWLTAILVVLGVVISAGVYMFWPVPYSSDAKLYIKYIQETRDPADTDGNSSVRSTDERGANILNTELEILDSLDTAEVAANMIGPGKVLGQSLPSNAISAYLPVAGNYILSNLKKEVPLKTDMIFLRYTAREADLARDVLSALILAYQTNYKAIHLTMGLNGTLLQANVDESKAELSDDMNALESIRAKFNITSLPDSKKNVTDQIFRKDESIDQVRAEIAETEAVIRDLQPSSLTNRSDASVTNNSTNIMASALPEPPTPEVMEKYRNLLALRASRLTEEQRWNLSGLTPNNKHVKSAQQRAAAAEADVQKFETDNPGLLAVKSNGPGNASSALSPSTDPLAALRFEVTKLHSLKARESVLLQQRVVVYTQATNLDSGDDEITKAEIKKDAAEAKYKLALVSRDRAVTDAGNNLPNIRIAEQPTPGTPDGKQIHKTAIGILGAFLALAFGLPFFIEMVLDQSFKQPMDVKARIAAPYFITIPRTNGHHKLPALKQAKPMALLSANGTARTDAGMEEVTIPLATNGQESALDERRELRPFFETLRDRLMTYFEMINLTHKPKLVAVTSCGEGAGVTTTAAGLASSLSEIGEGNVLLVNMNVRDGEAHHFYKGKLACGIEDLLGSEKRDQAKVHTNLYVANEAGSGESLPRVLPKRFSHLVPLMKASDYDYIIFDMPPVSEISITSRLARFMDMVLLVIESGKTSREAGMHAAALLAESKTNVGLVLNKNRSYLPKRLQNI